MGLVGLAKTVAIEGAKDNIHCNVIVPTAASRMTKDILPDIIYNELKPSLIAPVVTYLCHETNEENGAIIMSAAGWATKVRDYKSVFFFCFFNFHFASQTYLVQGQGSVLRTSLSETVTPEFVQKKWHKVTDMSAAHHCENSSQTIGNLMNMVDQLKSAGAAGANEVTDEFEFAGKDLILYALGIGASVRDPSDLKFLYENHGDFSALPTFFVMPGLLLSMGSSLVKDAITHTEFNLSQILHGEQYLEVVDGVDELPVDGKLTTRATVIDVMDKKSGAVVVTQSDTYDAAGRHLIRNQSSTFIVGAGNFNGRTKPSGDVIPAVTAPNRAADAVLQMQTSADQAALYRLSGDLNPLHIDPDFAKLGGQPVPILHGLCTLGELGMLHQRSINAT